MKPWFLMPFMLAVLIMPPSLAVAAPSDVSPVSAASGCGFDAATASGGMMRVRLILACLDGRAADGFVDNVAVVRPAARLRNPEACDCVVLD